jgi:hypothetical protein
MRRFIKAFWDIAIWRETPARLPASVLLLGLVAAAAALLEAVETVLPAAPAGSLPVRLVLAVLMPLCFTWLVLAIARKPQRFLQTSTALLGVAVLAELVLYPLESLLNAIDTKRLAALPLGVLFITALVWYLLACANIWRAALNSRLALGGVISVAYLLLSMTVEQQILPRS